MKTQSDIDLERHKMWIDILGAEYVNANKNKKKHMKDNYIRQLDYRVQLDACYSTGSATNNYAKLKKEIPMFNERQEQIDRIYRRSDNVLDELHYKGRKAFFLDAPRPKTIGEYKKWLTEGNFTLNTKDLSDDASYDYYSVSSFFRWGKDLPDKEGFDEWMKSVEKAQVNVKDQALLSYEAGLKALQDFENMEP